MNPSVTVFQVVGTGGVTALAGRTVVHVKRHMGLRALGVFGEPWAGVTAGAQPAPSVREQGLGGLAWEGGRGHPAKDLEWLNTR